MKDYREGMVELLRMSLLLGGEETDTVFARSDTEREAFARIPKTWSQKSNLQKLLRETELVHYGNRPIDETRYKAALDIGRAIFWKKTEAPQ